MFQELKSQATLTGWDDARNIASFKKEDVKYLIVYKNHLEEKSLPMACFLNTIEDLQKHKDNNDFIFFITNGKFHIDHVNAIGDKNKISNVVFIQETNSDDAIETINDYILRDK